MKNFTTTAMLFAVCTGALGQTAQLRVTAPGTAQKITRWINTGWLAHESLLKKSLSVSAGGDNTASLASITGIASFGLLTTDYFVGVFAPENEEADAVAGSLAGPAAESEDSLLIESVAYKDSHGVTHPALAKGTAVQITFINILATQFTAGALSDTVASYAESYGFCPLVSSGPEKGQDGQAILKTSSLSAIFGVKPVLNDTLILTGWVGGTITLHPYITSECVASVTAGSSASVAFSGHFNTSLTTIVGTAPGVTVKSASGAVY